MTTIALVTDLIFSTKITGTGKALNRPVMIARSLDKLHVLLDSVKKDPAHPPLLIVNLNATGPDPIAAINIAKSHPTGPHIVAYLSHIQADLAQKARHAGAHQILARSAFVEKLPILLSNPAPAIPRVKLSHADDDPMTTLELRSLPLARQAKADLLSICTRNGFSESDIFAMRIALEEALINAFKHGNKFDPAKTVRLQYRITTSLATFVIEDQGPGFNPDTLPNPTDDANLEVPTGRGIFLMRAYMNSVTFDSTGKQVTMLLKKHVPLQLG